MGRTRVLIAGAAGRDFHNFNLVYRDRPEYEVVAFTATQIPNIDGRRYPPELAGSQYPEGIPILPESALEELVRYTKEQNIDALLASQVVTQKGSDVKNFTALSELLEAEGLRDHVVLICGGPRVTNRLASELGYDAGFGRGTLPSEVAAFVAVTLAERIRDAAR